MTARGQIRNGTIVLAQPLELPEGAEVEVEVKQIARDGKPDRRAHIRKLAEGINYDFKSLDCLREASKL